MSQNELEAMQIIKALLKPLIPTLVELIDEYKVQQGKEPSTSSDVSDLFAATLSEYQKATRNDINSNSIAESAPVPAKTRAEKLCVPSADEQLYQRYLSLPESLRDSMRGFICKDGESYSDFIRSDPSIERFWTFCKNEVLRPDGDEHSQLLNDLFIYFSGKQPVNIQLYQPEQGMPYDLHMMTTSPLEKKRGTVERILLCGFGEPQEIENGSLKNKAVVVLV